PAACGLRRAPSIATARNSRSPIKAQRFRPTGSRLYGRRIMLRRTLIGALALMAPLLVAMAGARAFDETRYPDLKGQWNRVGAPRWANPKTAPLTAEYRAIFEANLADQAAGGQGMDPTASCLAPGMPRVMNAYEPMEIVVTAHTTYILMDHIHDWR